MMRTNTLLNILLVSIFCIASNTVKAQFADAIVSEISAGVTPVLAVNTGNSILESNGTDYIVNVWDDNGGPQSGISWSVGSAMGNEPIDVNAIVIDPDVTLIKNGAGTIYAIVVYFDMNTDQFFMRVFAWNAAQQMFIANPPVNLDSGQFGASINVDANEFGDFAIVWDLPGDIIRMTFGRAAAGSPPILTFPGASFDIDPGRMPDVSVFYDGINNIRQVNVTYISIVDEVNVDIFDFTDLQASIISPYPYFRSGPADLAYKYPRIDTPPNGSGTNEEFSVVVEDSDDISTWYIKCFNANSCCPGFTAYIYNDGNASNSPWNISSVPNTRPVVSYQNSANGVNVGWNFDNSFGLLAAPGASIAKFPIVLSCNKQAKIHISAQYLNVPTGVTFGTSAENLSISGRNSSNGLYSFINNFDNEFYFKAVPHVEDASNLRVTESGNFYQWLNDVYIVADNNVNSTIIVIMYDMMGREILNYNGSYSDFILEFHNVREKTLPGVYTIFANTESVNSNHRFTGKIFVSN